jgi:exonuclease SbcC
MRILQLRFKNLNSLAGEWQVDFTDAAYSSDGIFAITGPTGAGKSTILDAICLALYGRTPRLHRVTKASNEVMSRQAGECLAEVSFQTQAGNFRCCWGQHRSRKRAAGELQNPRHELVNADTGVVIDSSLRGVAEHIEAITGMDFDRFTRSMLLAQGGFAAFLQAAADQRAPLLEQITGTEIYSEISVRVHEIRSTEYKKLEALNAETQGIQVLDGEEEQSLDTSLQQKMDSEAAVTQQLVAVQRAINWLEGIARLELELRQLGQKKQDWQLRRDAFASDLQRLERANLALELAGDYAALCALRQQRESDRQTRVRHQAEQPDIEAAASRADAVMQAATAALALKQAEQKRAVPVIRQVRELDLRIAGTDKPIENTRRDLAEASTASHALGEQQRDDARALQLQRAALDKLLASLVADHADEKLVQQLAALEGRFNALKTLSGHCLNVQQEIERAQDQLRKIIEARGQHIARLATLQQAVQAAERELQEKRGEFENILDAVALAGWRSGQALLIEQQHQLRTVSDAAVVLLQAREQLLQLDTGKAQGMLEQSTLKGEHQAASERQRTLEREVELLETQCDLVEKIQGFTEARSQLKDGEPCPLCGAAEHPYARGNLPTPSASRRQHGVAKDNLKAVTIQLRELEVKLARVGSDLERMAADQTQLIDRVDTISRSLTPQCAALSIEFNPENAGPELLDRVAMLDEKNQQSLARHRHTVQTAEALELSINALRHTLEQSRRELASAEQLAQSNDFQRTRAEETLERLQLELDTKRAQQHRERSELQQQLKPYGVDPLAIESLDAIYAQLAARREHWLARQTQKIELQQQLATLELQIQHRSGQMQQAEAIVTRIEAQLAELLQERVALVDSRRQLFADRDPAHEEARLESELDSANQNIEHARQSLDAARQQLQQVKTRLESLANEIAASDRRIDEVAAKFAVQLAARGFTDEQQYQSVCLQHGEREQLAQLSQELADEFTTITASEREKSSALGVERAKSLSVQPISELQAELEQLQRSQRDLHQAIGAIRQRLAHNDSLKQQHRRQQQAVEAQRVECARWDQLHQLIGSADGKKYRNFAQGLTFDIMIAHANARLQKMTDRYLLVRDKVQALELCVLDNYQAGEVRSTKNLSGGESFIVSLALALGLSQMASKKVRVDSLFLDEGFGTLDEEALDTALETLVSLQQDGKLIGVISHVPALKERIATQIKISPRAGGKSEISGPGCSRIVSPQVVGERQ